MISLLLQQRALNCDDSSFKSGIEAGLAKAAGLSNDSLETEPHTGRLEEVVSDDKLRVSIRSFREGTPAGREAQVAVVRVAFQNQGMAQLGDHGIPAEVIKKCEERSRCFFDLPLERKVHD